MISALVVASCSSGKTPATGGATARATPSSATAGGDVVAISGDTVTVTRPDGSGASLVVGPATAYSEQGAADISEAVVGSYALGIGQRVAPDMVVAAQVVLTPRRPDGSCRRGAGGPVGRTGAPKTDPPMGAVKTSTHTPIAMAARVATSSRPRP